MQGAKAEVLDHLSSSHTGILSDSRLLITHDFHIRVLVEATYLGKLSIAVPPWQPFYHRDPHHIWEVDYCIVCAVSDGLEHTSQYSLSKLSILIIHHLLHA